eukprot:2686369-Rhodomonas_salina.1
MFTGTRIPWVQVPGTRVPGTRSPTRYPGRLFYPGIPYPTLRNSVPGYPGNPGTRVPGYQPGRVPRVPGASLCFCTPRASGTLTVEVRLRRTGCDQEPPPP